MKRYQIFDFIIQQFRERSTRRREGGGVIMEYEERLGGKGKSTDGEDISIREMNN